MQISEDFRRAGRNILSDPSRREWHEQRVHLGAAMMGDEPLQGALADMLVACVPNIERFEQLAKAIQLESRLPKWLVEKLQYYGSNSLRLPRINALATRFSVIAIPSMDVAERSLLCARDDSKNLASDFIKQIKQGDFREENAFLEHCEGAHDTLAFMLARREMIRAGWDLSGRWSEVSRRLENGTLKNE